MMMTYRRNYGKITVRNTTTYIIIKWMQTVSSRNMQDEWVSGRVWVYHMDEDTAQKHLQGF